MKPWTGPAWSAGALPRQVGRCRTGDELARRRRAALTPGQDFLLQAWGYPYVLEQFRFHLSLTGPLQALSREAMSDLLEAATTRFHQLPTPTIDSLSIFVEPTPGADFQLLEQIGFHS